MGVVNVNCPNCGASIQLSDEMNRGFCMFCGGQMQIQEAIQKNQTDRSGEFDNLLLLTKIDLQIPNFGMAQQRIQRALEIDATNPEAWLLYMYAECFVDLSKEGVPILINDGIIGGLYDSVRLCSERIMEYSVNNPKYQTKLNDFYIPLLLMNVWATWDGHFARYLYTEDEFEILFERESFAFEILEKVNTESLNSSHHQMLYMLACFLSKVTEYVLVRYEHHPNRHSFISEEYFQWRKTNYNKIRSLMPEDFINAEIDGLMGSLMERLAQIRSQAQNQDQKQTQTQAEPKAEPKADPEAVKLLLGCIFVVTLILLISYFVIV